jgi:hypothetical protein
MESTSIMVPIPSYVPPILTILDLALDNVLVQEGATNEGRTKLGKACSGSEI